MRDTERLQSVPHEGADLLADLRAEEIRRDRNRIRSAGGVQYPVGAVSMSPEDWKDHFGSMWPKLCEAKRRCDPGNLLTPGYNLF